VLALIAATVVASDRPQTFRDIHWLDLSAGGLSFSASAGFTGSELKKPVTLHTTEFRTEVGWELPLTDWLDLAPRVGLSTTSGPVLVPGVEALVWHPGPLVLGVGVAVQVAVWPRPQLHGLAELAMHGMGPFGLVLGVEADPFTHDPWVLWLGLRATL
jgi:hypothetical protein